MDVAEPDEAVDCAAVTALDPSLDAAAECIG